MRPRYTTRSITERRKKFSRYVVQSAEARYALSIVKRKVGRISESVACSRILWSGCQGDKTGPSGLMFLALISSPDRALPNQAAPPNRRPRFAFAALPKFDYLLCGPPTFLAAVGEPHCYCRLMRFATTGLLLAFCVASCAHHPSPNAVRTGAVAGGHCPKCGAALFYATPGVTTKEDIQEFAAHSKLRDKEQIVADGWIHPGAYCPNGCYEELHTYKRP